MTITEIRQILESPYDRKVWKNFLKAQFTNNKLNAEDRLIQLSDKTVSKQCLSLGNYEINEYTNIGIFEVELSEKINIARNRVALRSLIKDITTQVAGAMVVFVQGDKWRFSYISKRKVKNSETDTIEDKETAPRRYTYLFGKAEKALTAAQRFDKLIQKQKENIFQFLSLDDFEEAFSVEKLSKDFFRSYKEIYEDFVEFITGKRFVKKSSKWTEIKTHDAHFQLRNYFDNDEKQARDFCKRMMGRIVFLYFIQKKGWLAVHKGKKWGEGDPDYLFKLFDKAKYKESFYSDYLVPLFFETLNNPNVQKENTELRFPYLNGGLFDKSQDYRYDKIALPSEIFEKLFTTFNNFNFTIYEDAPDEHTVAVDPEMLGHIFENLLEDNKDKGAFYTPKEIVHYMCKESLKAYLFAHDEQLFANNEIAKETIDKIIQQQELNDDERAFAEKNAYKIIDALEEVKICDPAIGSGAFPMGLLQEIFNAQIYLQELKGFKKGVTDADIKKHIIEESIYGVDIDAGAVDIARLRFWLSLVVEEEVPQPLPNLAFKIVCANTLIPLSTDNSMQYQIAGATDIIKEIEKVRHNYFDASKDEKKDLERQFKNLQNKLWNTAKDWVTSKDAELYQRLLEFNPFEDKSCGWFDTWWMFGVKDGFDIVIGNPPYVQLSNNSGALTKMYEKIKYKTFKATGDIYLLFYERGWQLLKSKGVLCFVTSNSWMRSGYGENARKFFAEQANPTLLIDFAGQKIFDSATVEVNILMLTKDKNQHKTLACVVKDDVLNELSVFVRQVGSISAFTGADSWVILNSMEKQIMDKIERIGIPLKDWGVQINYGVKTGLNDAFIITGDKRKELLLQDPKSGEIIRPILRGRDIKRYNYNFADFWLINTHNGIKEKGITPINIDDYPAIKNHLDQFFPELEKRADKGETPYNLRNCAYMDDFSKQKIVWGEISDKANFALDKSDGYFINNKCYLLTGTRLEYLTCFLNSPLSEYLFSKIATTTGVGTLQWSKFTIEQLQVPSITKTQENEFAFLLSELSANKITKADIDHRIYELCELSEEEIKFIESL